MATLLLRMAAPLQSWGVDSKFETRNTEREPTKSGVIGLLAAALGRARTDDISDLCGLHFGVRVDKEGELLHDFHTAIRKEKNGKEISYVTHRYYLSDAVFLVAFETDNFELLEHIEYSLRHPRFPLFLGRRSCPPTQPLVLGIEDRAMLECLREYPLLVEKSGESCRLVFDDSSSGDGRTRYRDLPVSFSPEHRVFQYRLVAEKQVIIGIEHDPMRELGG